MPQPDEVIDKREYVDLDTEYKLDVEGEPVNMMIVCLEKRLSRDLNLNSNPTLEVAKIKIHGVITPS